MNFSIYEDENSFNWKGEYIFFWKMNYYLS